MTGVKKVTAKENNEKKPTFKEHDHELRFTFSTQFTEVDRIKTAIQEQAFKLSLPCNFETIGGLKNQTVGVIVRSDDEAAMQKFEDWYTSTIDHLLEPRGWLGLAIKEYL